MVYDRRGRATTVTNGAAVCALAYNDANQLLSETNSAGTLVGLWVTNTYDSFGLTVVGLGSQCQCAMARALRIQYPGAVYHVTSEEEKKKKCRSMVLTYF